MAITINLLTTVQTNKFSKITRRISKEKDSDLIKEVIILIKIPITSSTYNEINWKK